LKPSQFLSILIIGGVLILALSACTTGEESSEPKPDFGMNDPVEVGDWRITVLVTEEYGTEFSRGGITIWTHEEDSHLFFVQIYLENLSGADIGEAFQNKAVVRDSKGNTYDWWWVGSPGMYFESKEVSSKPRSLMQPTTENHYVIVVPDGVKILDFIWDDFPAIRLTIE